MQSEDSLPPEVFADSLACYRVSSLLHWWALIFFVRLFLFFLCFQCVRFVCYHLLNLPISLASKNFNCDIIVWCCLFIYYFLILIDFCWLDHYCHAVAVKLAVTHLFFLVANLQCMKPVLLKCLVLTMISRPNHWLYSIFIWPPLQSYLEPYYY